MKLATREAMSLQQLLDQVAEQLPVADKEQRRGDSAAAPPATDELASPLSLANIRARARAALAAPVEAAARQARLAALADEALQAQRPHSALLVFEMAERRAWKARAQGKSAMLSRDLVRVGLLAQVALRRREAYEGLLRHAQQGWEIELDAEPELLSAAMGACCEAGWVQHALACNETLSAAGLTADTAALNALMAARLRRGDDGRALDVFLHMRRHGPRPDPQSHALAMRAAAARKTSWSGLRNLMRRAWLKVAWCRSGVAREPWPGSLSAHRPLTRVWAPCWHRNHHSANAAFAHFVERGNLRGAADVLAHMAETNTPLQAVALEKLLRFATASRRGGSSRESVLALRCVAAGRGAGWVAAGSCGTGWLRRPPPLTCRPPLAAVAVRCSGCASR